uniref:Uncharacterized protein n=1 Tax=Arundo donax TaxID=35708 RepID=A0A0A9EVP1_ARUDO
MQNLQAFQNPPNNFSLRYVCFIQMIARTSLKNTTKQQQTYSEVYVTKMNKKKTSTRDRMNFSEHKEHSGTSFESGGRHKI